jgi:hypothetical protein
MVRRAPAPPAIEVGKRRFRNAAIDGSNVSLWVKSVISGSRGDVGCQPNNDHDSDLPAGR